MNRSPFIESYRRPPRRRRRGALLALALAVAAAGALAWFALRGGSSKPNPGPSLGLGHHVATASGNLLSPRFGRNPRAGLLVDADTGRVLWRLNPNRVMPIASLAKMMTAVLVARRTRATEPVRITKQALAYQGSGVGVLPRGRTVPAETLLYGLLLPSGNDAAIALAQHVAGTVGRFVALMNRSAADLGLTCTHYASVDGFADANRSCPRDLAVLAKRMLATPRLARIVRTRVAVLPLPIKKVYLYNNNPLIRRLNYPGVTGVKTGETNAAGLCLVASATRGHVHLISVLLHSPDLGKQSAALLNAGFRYEHAG